MGPELQAHVAFHLTGKRLGAGLAALDGLDLRPGLLARYGDLTQLRYDFPLVLVASRADEGCIQSLSGLVNGVLQEIAPHGTEGERTRRHVLRLEREIRTAAASGTPGSLAQLWEAAAARIGTESDPALAGSLRRARTALQVNGEVVDCTHDLPLRIITHAWTALQQRKAESFEQEIRRLIIKLSEILQTDFLRSDAGRSAPRLKAAVGAAMEDAFDFDAMSSVLARVSGKDSLPESRRQRVQWALAELKSHQSLAKTGAGWPDLKSYVFTSCRDALAAFRNRLPEIIDLVKAIAITELEIEGSYLEATHDPFFADFDETSVGAKDLGLLPDYLVCIRSENLHAPENTELTEILSSEMPVKVVVQIGDILEEPSLRAGHLGFTAPAAQLGKMAMGLGTVYVLQSSSSHLYQMRRQILAGLRYPGPALFSTFAGSPRAARALPPYLLAAAAMQSRAFPAFTYDPAAGADWASRFSLDQNPQPEADWPAYDFGYEDEARQSVSEQLAFSFVDFVACDPRYAKHFAIVPRVEWNGSLVPVGRGLAGEAASASGKVPFLHMVDRDCVLRRVLVDEKLIAAAHRCRETWHGLQELGNIRSSQTEQLLARERKTWEEQKQREIDALKREARPAPAAAAPVAPAPAAPAAPKAAPAAAEAAEPEKPSDEAYIETPRCTTCNECTNLNNRMFAYDANKQAYIADINAGTYRELVEAAESCQVSIVHPGKPRNPNEPGIADLLKRAEPFL
jgi:hypothetical protein